MDFMFTSRFSLLWAHIATARALRFVGVIICMGVILVCSVAAADALVQPASVIIDHSLPRAQLDAQILAARRSDTFWDTGDESLAMAALATDFVDRTLPRGRLQGVAGPLETSRTVRAAVPDIRCGVEQMIVAGDHVVVHLHFNGHFTGRFKNKEGQGQVIDFIATDIYRVVDGRISDNWHLEDNPAFFEQLGFIEEK